MIINTGRGQLIHTNALIEGLKKQQKSAPRPGCVRRGKRNTSMKTNRTKSLMTIPGAATVLQ